MSNFKKYLATAFTCFLLTLTSGLFIPTLAWNSNVVNGQEILSRDLANGGTSRSDQWPAEVVIDSISGNGVGISTGPQRPTQAAPGQTFSYRRRLHIRAGSSNGANLRFVTQSGSLSNYLASAGRHPSRSSEYYFPCGASNRFVIGWRSGGRGGCDPVSFSPNRATRIGPAANTSPPPYLAEADLGKQENNDLWVARINLRHYCSAIADTGNQWGVSLSEQAWSEEEVEAVCQQAVETCEASGDQSCFVAHRGDWRRHNPKYQFRNIDLLLQCEQGREYHRKVSDLEVVEGWQQLEQEALTDRASACVLYMYYFDEVLITPVTDQRTLIYTDSSEAGFVINDVLGAVEITVTSPSDTDLQKVQLRPGERYVATYESGTVEIETIPPEDRLEIADAPTVRSFLDENQWDDSAKADIAAYNTDFRENFLPEPPAIKVEQQTIAGVSVVVAEIDLENPDTILTVSHEDNVRRAGGLLPFARQNNAALVLSGTFEDANDSNWTTISEGRFLEGQQSRNWSNYTVLGLRRGNQPEMLARRNQPEWDAYWFALTGHPRLVSNGVPGVTEVAPGSTLDINGDRGRAAIGFSRSPNKLYHVITNTGIPLSKMAEVMKEVGCDEAMNLEGGGGYFIVHRNQVYGPGEVRAPVIIVNDAESPPAEAVRQSFQTF
jgi:hypothetical protein